MGTPSEGANYDLIKIRPLIFRKAFCGKLLWTFSLKVDTGSVMEDDIELEVKEVLYPLKELLLNLFFMKIEKVEGARIRLRTMAKTASFTGVRWFRGKDSSPGYPQDLPTERAERR